VLQKTLSEKRHSKNLRKKLRFKQNCIWNYDIELVRMSPRMDLLSAGVQFEDFSGATSFWGALFDGEAGINPSLLLWERQSLHFGFVDENFWLVVERISGDW